MWCSFHLHVMPPSPSSPVFSEPCTYALCTYTWNQAGARTLDAKSARVSPMPESHELTSRSGYTKPAARHSTNGLRYAYSKWLRHQVANLYFYYKIMWLKFHIQSRLAISHKTGSVRCARECSFTFFVQLIYTYINSQAYTQTNTIARDRFI